MLLGQVPGVPHPGGLGGLHASDEVANLASAKLACRNSFWCQDTNLQ